MNIEINDIFENVPTMINCSIEMKEANEPIKIYDGEYIIRNGKHEIKIKGTINFNWFPNAGVYFSGKILIDYKEYVNIEDNFHSIVVVVNGLEIGSGLIVHKDFINGLDREVFIKGALFGKTIFGDKTIHVDKIRFSIPNLREYYGSLIEKIASQNITTITGRIKLVNNDYEIIIDKCLGYSKLKDSVNSNGGYINLYGGELKKIKGSLTLNDVENIFFSLHCFLSFLNGRRTSALFRKGIFKDEIIWSDFTNYQVDTYKSVTSWTNNDSVNSFNNLWQKFSLFWKNENDKIFFTTVIHWYIEANNKTGFSEGSIIMAQTALELIYNWWIIENKKLITGSDTESIKASNKIRLVLSQLNIDYSVPISLINLQIFANKNKEKLDGPESIVQIRNAIVHSQEEKRKKLYNISDKVKQEALQLCIWYIEMSLLYILEFDDNYNNRCPNETGFQPHGYLVPWTKINKKD